MTIDPEGERPIYQQLADVLREMIMSGELPAGRALPSEQVLRQIHGVSRGTARHAAALLVAEGLLRTSPGRGHYVVPAKERPR